MNVAADDPEATAAGLQAALAPLRAVLAEGRLSLRAGMWERGAVHGAAPPDGLARDLDPAARRVFELLVAPRPVARAAAVAALGEACVRALVRREALRETADGRLDAAGLRLRVLPGASLLAGDGGPRRYVHLGHDTLRVIEAIARLPPGRRGLELCAGGAGPAIALARHHAEVVAVEICRPVARVAEVNVALAGLGERVEVRGGDLWAPVAGERFDTIVANPPFSPDPGDPHDDPAAVAGPDGLDVARAIWSRADAHLTAQGRLVVLLGMLGDAAAPRVLGELEGLAAAKGWRVEVLALDAPRPVERLVIPRLQEEPVERRLRQIRGGAARTGTTHYHVALLRMGPDPEPGLVRLDLFAGPADAWRARAAEMRRTRPRVPA